MSFYLNVGERGEKVQIIPSARKPIHNISHTDTMSYKKSNINTSRERNIQSSNIGVDEVDNIFSKHVRPSSPIAIRKELPSGSALDAELSDSDDDSSNEEPLSESPYSSPGSLSNSYSKNESPNYEYQSIAQSDRENLSRRVLSHQYSQERKSSIPSIEPDEQILKKYTIYIPALIALVFGVYYLYDPSTEKTVFQNNYDKFSFYSDVKSLAQQYKVKGDAMLQIQTAINTIFEKQDTASFIFTYDGGMANFDPVKFNKFMDNIASAASRYLRNNTKNVQHIVLDNSKIISLKSDYELINQYRDTVEKRGVLLVKDIEKVPSNLAMAFHYYCDEYNPLVKKSAIFFTLNVAECSTLDQKPTHEYIERCLKTKWKEIQKDKIGPLLTRVVNIVVDVISV
ncbi:uncharacterized protein LOC123698654 [Colias croceus]|uniref:uncharacterized protein LOC123698654 n=1 Tax=Colias crocea TaxID=72248 RepID=UPI001E27E4A1|nr:uncharacterized protein LOC123698654 [Colias croceus]XP_045501359.1 uncharacterized protein LOC123698654 [Colias croceus]XP_045501367.1 uncharacterized protein LOC123698654 [Colias croceus]XP_045501372.1 uncharacterized protein LOC123698654 [Colias croceus]